MPPKKEEPPPMEPIPPSEKEIEMQNELDALEQKMERLKMEVEKMQKKNQFLQQEASQTRTESHEYQVFMAKKANKRKSLIVTLSEQNEFELNKIEAERDALSKMYEERKEELQENIVAKEERLSKLKGQRWDLEEWEELRDQQMVRIDELQKEVKEKRQYYSDELQKMKIDFLVRRAQYQKETDERVAKLGREAEMKARACLLEHTTKIKEENVELSEELTELLKKSKMLNEHKHRLIKQNRELVREQQYNSDIKRLRGANKN